MAELAHAAELGAATDADAERVGAPVAGALERPVAGVALVDAAVAVVVDAVHTSAPALRSGDTPCPPPSTPWSPWRAPSWSVRHTEPPAASPSSTSPSVLWCRRSLARAGHRRRSPELGVDRSNAVWQTPTSSSSPPKQTRVSASPSSPSSTSRRSRCPDRADLRPAPRARRESPSPSALQRVVPAAHTLRSGTSHGRFAPGSSSSIAPSQSSSRPLHDSTRAAPGPRAPIAPSTQTRTPAMQAPTRGAFGPAVAGERERLAVAPLVGHAVAVVVDAVAHLGRRREVRDTPRARGAEHAARRAATPGTRSRTRRSRRRSRRCCHRSRCRCRHGSRLRRRSTARVSSHPARTRARAPPVLVAVDAGVVRDADRTKSPPVFARTRSKLSSGHGPRCCNRWCRSLLIVGSKKKHRRLSHASSESTTRRSRDDRSILARAVAERVGTSDGSPCRRRRRPRHRRRRRAGAEVGGVERARALTVGGGLRGATRGAQSEQSADKGETEQTS